MMKHTPIEVLQHNWPLILLSGVTALIVTPVVRWIAYRANIVDRPDDELKPHARPIAYLGGLAVCAGFIPPIIITVIRSHPDLWILATTIIVAAVIVTLTGLLDDLRNLTPKKKLLGQILAAAVLFVGLCTVDVHTSAAGMLSIILDVPFPIWVSVPLSAMLTVVVLIAACNATNLLDGLDGLCGGVTGVIAVAFLALTTFLACFARQEGLDEFRVVLCLAMAGAALGFLPYNVPPASIFLGDAGSMLLGFFVATITMLLAAEGTLRWFLAAGVIFGLPIIDTALAVVRRLIRRVNIFAGDRSHLYDQLVDRGMSVTKVVVLFYFLALVAGVLGVVQAVYLRLRHAALVDLGVLIIVAVIFLAKGMILPSARGGGPAPDASEGQPEASDSSAP